MIVTLSQLYVPLRKFEVVVRAFNVNGLKFVTSSFEVVIDESNNHPMVKLCT